MTNLGGNTALKLLMFLYRPPKSSCWGNAIRPKDPIKAKAKVNDFFAAYFEPLEPEWDPSRQMTLTLNWKTSILPRVEWAPEYSKPGNEQWQKVMFIVTGDRIIFMLGLVFPISVNDLASYEFLRQFSENAPFKMSAKHFQTGLVGKNGKLAWRKPDPGVAARLHEFIA
jgi:hypothetical protein